jgi:hypothetical protein
MSELRLTFLIRNVGMDTGIEQTISIEIGEYTLEEIVEIFRQFEHLANQIRSEQQNERM